MSASPGPGAHARTLGLLVGLAAVAFAFRSFGLEWVFVGDEVVFPPADPQYHLRRAFYTFVNFPDVLLFDPYINHPGGASVPWPPLYDFGLGAVAWLLADDQRGFEVVVAWAGPLLGALCVVPIYLTARQFGPRWVGALAGAIFAILPMSVGYSRVGNADHHAAVGLIGAWLLYCCVRLSHDGLEAQERRRLGVALYCVRVTLLLTWHGSLLYLALAEACLLTVGIAHARPALLRVQALSALAVVATIAPLLALMPTPLLGDYSSIALSRLHVLAMAGVAIVAGGVLQFQSRRPGSGWLAGFAFAAGLGVAYVALLIALPPTREGLIPAFSFLTMTDGMGHVTGEQTPIFSMLGRAPGMAPEKSWGWFAYLIPLAPAAVLFGWKRGEADAGPGSAPRLVLGIWGLFFGALAISQRRYGNDFAASASVLFALGAAGVARQAMARSAQADAEPPHWAWSCIAAFALTMVLSWPMLGLFHAERYQNTRAAFAGDRLAKQRTEYSVAYTLTRFMQQVRAATPETSGFTESGVGPEYGVIAHPNLGHALQYGARRATATDPFWAYIGEENWARTRDFLQARTEGAALRIAETLDGRYVVTMPDAPVGSVSEQLHHWDGRAVDGRPALERFRLVAEAGAFGQSIGAIFSRDQAGEIPYKLFEIVEGAHLSLSGEPGEVCVIDLDMRASSGRAYAYQARAVLDPTGRPR